MKKAFTLVEIVVVIILLGILAAIVVPNQTQYIGSAKSVDYSTVKRTILNEIALITAELQTQEQVTRSNSGITVNFPLIANTDNDCLDVFKVLSGRANANGGAATATDWGTLVGINNICKFSSPRDQNSESEIVMTVNVFDCTLNQAFEAPQQGGYVVANT